MSDVTAETFRTQAAEHVRIARILAGTVTADLHANAAVLLAAAAEQREQLDELKQLFLDENTKVAALTAVSDNPKTQVTWSATKQWLRAHPDKTAAIVTPGATYVVRVEPAAPFVTQEAITEWVGDE